MYLNIGVKFYFGRGGGGYCVILECVILEVRLGF